MSPHEISLLVRQTQKRMRIAERQAAENPQYERRLRAQGRAAAYRHILQSLRPMAGLPRLGVRSTA